MRRVSNQKTIRTLSFRTMKEKKGKNLIAILAIALTTLLFTALFTVGSSMLESIQEATFRQVGTCAHGGYKNVTMEEYEHIRKAGGIRDISYDIIAGFGVNTELNAIQTEVRFAEDKMAKWSYSYPEEGRMPEAFNECAASSKVLEALGIPLKVGEKVPLKISTHDGAGNEKMIEQEFVLSGFWYSNDASRAQELWISRQWLEKNVEFPEQNYEERMNQTGAYSVEGYMQIGLWFDSSFDIEGQMEELTRRAGYSEENLHVSVNWAYAASDVDGVTLILGIGILFLIILSGYLIIYNIFYINVTADIRYYGLLKTIGTTGKQLWHIVRFQALLLSAVGIPLGLLGGWFVGKGVLPAVYAAINTDGVRNVALNPYIFLGAALFALLVVYLSCIRPCYLASRVSPIEAVRYVENIQYKKKEKKSGRVSMARMAAANMGRNRRKAVVVIASLSLSLILLNATYCLVKGFSFEKYVQDYLLTDMQLSHYSTVNLSSSYRDYQAITPQMKTDLERISGVESVNVVYYMSEKAILPKDVLTKFSSYYLEAEETGEGYVEQVARKVAESGQTNGNYYCLPEELLPFLEITEGTFDKEKFEQGGYVLLLEQMDAEKWLSVGDKMIAGFYENEETSENKTGNEKELEVMAVAKLPYALSTRSYWLCGAGFLMSGKDFEELYEAKGGLHACIELEEGAQEEAKIQIEELIEKVYPDLVLTTRESLKKEFSTENNMFSVVGGLLGFILALIGILNLINAMITSILARKQEFAMMQAVGMTGRQLRQMLTMEGVWYGVLTLLISATLGSVVSYGFIYMIGKNMAYFVWDFHVLPLLVSVPVIGILSVVLPIICYNTLCKKSIIERLRLAEV